MGWCKPKLAVALPPLPGVDLKDIAEGEYPWRPEFQAENLVILCRGRSGLRSKSMVERLGTRWSGIEAFGWACVSKNKV